MRDGFLRVAAATPDVKVADVEFNRKQMEESILDARKKGAKILVFPELGLKLEMFSGLDSLTI